MSAKEKSRYAQAGASIKKELARAFPGIKFSVRSKSFSMGNSVDVSWSFGPTSAEVDAIINKYQYGHFDGMIDCYEYDRDKDREAFRAANGSSKYVMSQRDIPHEVFLQVCRDIAALQGVEFTSTWQRRENDSLGLDDYAYRALGRTSFPAGAQYAGVASGFELTLTGACMSGDAYRIIHTMTDEQAEMREVVKKEFNYIKQQEAQEAQRICGVVVLAPDDLRIPCILPAGHIGYCDTGR